MVKAADGTVKAVPNARLRLVGTTDAGQPAKWHLRAGDHAGFHFGLVPGHYTIIAITGRDGSHASHQFAITALHTAHVQLVGSTP